jgi:hypothetical protein
LLLSAQQLLPLRLLVDLTTVFLIVTGFSRKNYEWGGTLPCMRRAFVLQLARIHVSFI